MLSNILAIIATALTFLKEFFNAEQLDKAKTEGASQEDGIILAKELNHVADAKSADNGVYVDEAVDPDNRDTHHSK